MPSKKKKKKHCGCWVGPQGPPSNRRECWHLGGPNRIHPGLQVSLISQLDAWQSVPMVHPAAQPLPRTAPLGCHL